MTTIALSQLVHEAPAFLQRISQRIAAFFEGIEEARQLAHRYSVLAQMTDAQLATRGLKREDIPQAVLGNSVRS
jgi:uncharacterized protein YjiS (DUF1127 family)